MGLLNCTIKTIECLDHSPLLINKIEIFTMLEEMFDRVQRIALRCQDSNVIVLDGRRRYEDAPEAVEQMRRAVG